ncbi:PEGA domain-containing protein [candidate division GN15 bacterium]|nr:PEGA domain-containing protein [candidate division GN15 bacterium]
MFRLCVLLSALLLSFCVLMGCASIIHGTSQEILFQTIPDGATVSVEDAMGKRYGSCQTPCTLDLKRKREYKVIINKPGYSEATLVLEKKTDGWIWGNIVFGGIIGLIVDFSNGAAYKLSPSELSVTLQESTVGQRLQSEDGPSLVLFDFDDLSEREQAEIQKLPSIDLSLLY